MKKVTVVNKSLYFYKEDDEVDQFIEESMMDATWGSPEEAHVTVTDWKSTRQIMQDIFRGCGSQEQQFRIIAGLDAKGSFATILNDDNYALARYKMQECMMEGKITTEDMGIINSVIPTGEILYEYQSG